MRKVIFMPIAMEHLKYWIATKPKLALRLLGLIDEVVRNPFSGTGKPEPLKENLKGYWSRRINEEHRLVYKVSDDEIVVMSAKGHYIKSTGKFY